MEMYVWLMEMPQQEELKFASVVCGVLCVMTYGIAMMQESFAGNLDYQQNFLGQFTALIGMMGETDLSC
jgi:hypothetical protein